MAPYEVYSIDWMLPMTSNPCLLTQLLSRISCFTFAIKHILPAIQLKPIRSAVSSSAAQGHLGGTLVAAQPIVYCLWMASLNLFVICGLFEWQCVSVQWFVPWEWACLCQCCRQQLRYNCAWIQDTGIYWIQGGVFSIRGQWNTFSASRVAWRTTAKGGLGSIMMPGTIVPLFCNPFPGNHTTCAIVHCALLPSHVARL